MSELLRHLIPRARALFRARRALAPYAIPRAEQEKLQRECEALRLSIVDAPAAVKRLRDNTAVLCVSCAGFAAAEKWATERGHKIELTVCAHCIRLAVEDEP